MKIAVHFSKILILFFYYFLFTEILFSVKFLAITNQLALAIGQHVLAGNIIMDQLGLRQQAQVLKDILDSLSVQERF